MNPFLCRLAQVVCRAWASNGAGLRRSKVKVRRLIWRPGGNIILAPPPWGK